VTHSNESVSAALGALSCQRDLEKQGFLEPVVGGAIGAYKSPRGSRLDGAGHGVVTGLGTGLGAGALGGLGALGGSALGPAGSIAGLLAGLGAGGYGGFRASNAMQRSLRGGPLPYDADFEPKEKSEEKKEKTKDGDGDGKVNDGTPEEKQAFTVPKTPPSGSMSLPPGAASALGTGVAAAQQGVGAANGMRGAMQGLRGLGKQFLSGGATGAPPPSIRKPEGAYGQGGNPLRDAGTGGAGRLASGAMKGLNGMMQNLPRPGFSPGQGGSLPKGVGAANGKGVAPGKSIMIDNYRRLQGGGKGIGSQLMQQFTDWSKSGSARPHAENRLQNIKLASTILNMHAIGQELAACNLHQLSKSAAVGAHKEERMKAAALIRQYELEKQAALTSIAGRLASGLATAGRGLESFGRQAALPAATAATGGIIGNEIGHRKGYASGDAKGYGRGSAEGGANATRNLFKGLMDLQQKGSGLPDTDFNSLGGQSGEQPGDFAKTMSRLYSE